MLCTTINPEKLLVVKLWGGLGNQMFQYAFGLSVAKTLNRRLLADIRYFYHTPAGDTKRCYELGAYQLDLKFATEIELPHPEKNWLEKALNRMNGKPRWTKLTESNYYTYDNDLLKRLETENHLYLEGYWQSYKYFEPVRENLLEAFKLKTPLNLQQQQNAKEINSHNSVAVHVRRGDYVLSPRAAAVHNIYSADYYAKALDYLAAKQEKAFFYIFSDDIPWCEANLPVPYPHGFISPDETAAVDLYLMSICKHQIIANSSFSWWGAWLCTNPDQIVVAPQKWLSEGNTNYTADGLILPNWLRF